MLQMSQALASCSAAAEWKPYPKSTQDGFVWVPKAGRPIYPAKAITIGGASYAAIVSWGKQLQRDYPDGEHSLVADHLEEMMASFTRGQAVKMPTNKYAKRAVEGFLISIQSLKDHGVRFE
jgi:hypothetical protein